MGSLIFQVPDSFIDFLLLAFLRPPIIYVNEGCIVATIDFGKVLKMGCLIFQVPHILFLFSSIGFFAATQ